eukprot:6223168-Pyramimonas_sp.AAC.1
MPPSRRQLLIVADRWCMRGASVCGSAVRYRIELMPPFRVTPLLVDLDTRRRRHCLTSSSLLVSGSRKK